MWHFFWGGAENLCFFLNILHRKLPRENHDHLLFVSYPCGFAKFANRRIDDWPEKLESGHLVQCFNIVLLDLGLGSVFFVLWGKGGGRE